MSKQTLSFFFLLFINKIFSQNIQLRYPHSNAKIIAAVTEANRILADELFYLRIDSIRSFDNTTYTGRGITNEMRAIQTIEVGEFYKAHTKTTAKTLTKIRLNTGRLNRSLAAITKTLIHETVHAVDWNTDKRWNYTHRTQHEEKPPVSAPYIIGAIAEKMAQNH